MPRSLQASHDEIVTRAVRLLQAWIAREHHLYELAGVLGVSYGFLEGIFKATVGVDLTTYRTFIRLHHARRLLACTALPILEVARLAGFRHQSHFAKVFRDSAGMTPSEYRTLVVMQADGDACPARRAKGCLLAALKPEARATIRWRANRACAREEPARATAVKGLVPVGPVVEAAAVEATAVEVPLIAAHTVSGRPQS